MAAAGAPNPLGGGGYAGGAFQAPAPAPLPGVKTLDAQLSAPLTEGYTVENGHLVLPNGDRYRIRLFRGSKEVTDTLLREGRPEVFEMMAKIALDVLETQHVKPENLGDRILVTQDAAKGIVVNNNGREYTAGTREFREDYRALTNRVLSVLRHASFDKVDSSSSSRSSRVSSEFDATTKPSQVSVNVKRRGAAASAAAATSAPVRRAHPDATRLTPEEVEAERTAIRRDFAPYYNKEPAKVQQIVRDWLEKVHMNLYQDGQIYGEMTYPELLQERGNEALRLALNDIVAGRMDDMQGVPPKNVGDKDNDGEYTNIKNILLKYLRRNQREIRFATPNGHGKQVQKFAMCVDGQLATHLKEAEHKFQAHEIQTMFKANAGWSSETDKDPSEELAHHCTNLGVVTTTRDDGTSYVSCLRSGKTHNVERIKENVLFGCLATLNTTEQIGLKPVGDGVYEYQQMMTSFMDYAWLKHLGWVDPSKFSMTKSKRFESERDFLNEVLAAFEAYPEQGIRVSLPDPNDSSKQITVILKKPIIISQMLSATLRLPDYDSMLSNLKKGERRGKMQAGQISWAGNQQLFALYLAKQPDLMRSATAAGLDTIKYGDKTIRINFNDGSVREFSPDGSSKAVSFVSMPQAFWTSTAFTQHQDKQREFLKNAIESTYQGMVKAGHGDPSYVDSKRKMDNLIAFYASFYGRYPAVQGAIPDSLHLDLRDRLRRGKEVQTSDLVIYRKMITRELRIVTQYQCKSGVDRTGVGVGDVAASDQFEVGNGHPYLPHEHPEPPRTKAEPEDRETEEMRHRFDESIKQFAFPVTLLSKGKWGISWEIGRTTKLGHDFEKQNTSAFKYLPKERLVGGVDNQNPADSRHPYNPETPYALELQNPRAVLGESIKDFKADRKKQREADLKLMQGVQAILEQRAGIQLNAGLNLQDQTWQTVRDAQGRLDGLEKELAGARKAILDGHPSPFKALVNALPADKKMTFSPQEELGPRDFGELMGQFELKWDRNHKELPDYPLGFASLNNGQLVEDEKNNKNSLDGKLGAIRGLLQGPLTIQNVIELMERINRLELNGKKIPGERVIGKRFKILELLYNKIQHELRGVDLLLSKIQELRALREHCERLERRQNEPLFYGEPPRWKPAATSAGSAGAAAA